MPGLREDPERVEADFCPEIRFDSYMLSTGREERNQCFHFYTVVFRLYHTSTSCKLNPGITILQRDPECEEYIRCQPNSHIPIAVFLLPHPSRYLSFLPALAFVCTVPQLISIFLPLGTVHFLLLRLLHMT